MGVIWRHSKPVQRIARNVPQVSLLHILELLLVMTAPPERMLPQLDHLLAHPALPVNTVTVALLAVPIVMRESMRMPQRPLLAYLVLLPLVQPVVLLCVPNALPGDMLSILGRLLVPAVQGGNIL